MKLYYSPNSCAIGIHLLLEEIGSPYELELVDLRQGEQFKKPFASLNPKKKVPALLRDDGTLLTEWQAIAVYLARMNPDKNLLPTDIEGEVRCLELLDYLIATVHMRGFTRIFRPGAFTPTVADEPAVQQTGRDIVVDALKLLEAQLSGREYALGARLSIADAALFFIESWAADRADITLPPALAGHLARMRARPAMQRTLAAEGLA
jgi:glutathione S-transferase